MKKLITLTMVLAWMASAPALAADRTLTATINGLVCDFCAQALEKVFGKRDEVQAVEVNLNEKRLSLAMQDGADLEDETVRKLIEDSGYNTVSIDRNYDAK